MPVADWKICGILSSPTPCDCAPRWGARSSFRADPDMSFGSVVTSWLGP